MDIATPKQIEDEASVSIRDETFRILITEEAILKRVAEIGMQISHDYEGRKPILIGVLNGAFIFVSDLMREISISCEIDFIKLSSYGAEKVSSGQVHELKRIDADITGRHVIVVEDIVDTGHSMKFILESFEEFKPASVAVAAFLHKAVATKVDLKLDYVGFEIQDHFVIGYGLDYGQLGRNLRSIYVESSDHPSK